MISYCMCSMYPFLLPHTRLPLARCCSHCLFSHFVIAAHEGPDRDIYLTTCLCSWVLDQTAFLSSHLTRTHFVFTPNDIVLSFQLPYPRGMSFK